MKMLPANPGLTDLDERARSIFRRVRKLRAEGKLDALAEQTAVLDLARLEEARRKIEAARPAKKRRRPGCTPLAHTRDPAARAG